MNNLINKNNDLILQIQAQKLHDENINNYCLDNDNEYTSSDNDKNDNDNDNDNDNKIIKNSSSSDLLDDIDFKKNLNKTCSDDSINERLFKFDHEYYDKLKKNT